MHDEDLIRGRFEEALEVKRALLAGEHVAFTAAAAAAIADALRDDGKVLFCGNGGSAADATHLAAELVGRFYVDRGPLPALSLSDNASALTCISNDFSFDEVFARQVRAHGREGDVLVAISTSGSSPNVLRAAEAARELGLTVIGLTSAGGDDLAAASDLCLRAPSTDTPRVQEAHMLVGHTICELVEQALFSASGAQGAEVPSRP